MSQEENDKAAESDELSLFVTSTLNAIMSGIAMAQPNAALPSLLKNGTYEPGSPKAVDFEIALSAKRTGGVNGGFKVQVFGIGGSTQGKTDAEDATVSKIRFSIPIYFRRYEND